MNKVWLVGNLGADPDVRVLQSGSSVCNFNLATTERWRTKDGEKNEKTEWHRVVCFGKLAELCRDYLSKGQKTSLVGKLQTREWEDKNGNKRQTTEVVAQEVEFLSFGQRAKEGVSRDGEFSPAIADEDVPF